MESREAAKQHQSCTIKKRHRKLTPLHIYMSERTALHLDLFYVYIYIYDLLYTACEDDEYIMKGIGEEEG